MHTASTTADPDGPRDGRDTTGVPDYVDLAWHGDDSRRPGPQRSLQMRAIAAVGVELADEGGLSRVSMRTVGARLGMTGMGLYRYVRAKDELLALMIDEALGPPDFPAYGPVSWRDRLTAWAYAARSRFEAHPWVLGVSLPDPPALPYQTQWTERGLEALQPTPLAETEKLSALLLVNVYVRGQTQLATGLGRRVQPGDNPGQRYAQMLLRLADPERFPCLVAAMTQHAAAPPADFTTDEFRFGLGTVLDGIASRMTPGVLLWLPDEAEERPDSLTNAPGCSKAGPGRRLWWYPRTDCPVTHMPGGSHLGMTGYTVFSTGRLTLHAGCHGQ